MWVIIWQGAKISPLKAKKNLLLCPLDRLWAWLDQVWSVNANSENNCRIGTTVRDWRVTGLGAEGPI
jgi:hypothetical protein